MSLHVVGVAVIRGGRVLAARRCAPPELAGRWEFPGGKVEPGEGEAAAAARECREELGIEVTVRDRIGEAVDGRIRLVLYAATPAAGEPLPLQDHDALRWLAPDDLDEVAWLPVDRALLAPVRVLLQRCGEG